MGGWAGVKSLKAHRGCRLDGRDDVTRAKQGEVRHSDNAQVESHQRGNAQRDGHVGHIVGTRVETHDVTVLLQQAQAETTVNYDTLRKGGED